MGQRGAILLFAWLVATPLASAAPVGKAEARRAYEAGNEAFAHGQFGDAAELFMKANDARPDAAFLYNAAQAYRLAGKNRRALALLQQYLERYPRAANRAEVAKMASDLDQRASEREASEARPVPQGEEPRARELPAREPAPPKPIYKRWWPWTILGVVVVAGVVTTAVLLTRPPPAWENVPATGPGAMQGALNVRPLLELRLR